MEQKLKIAVFIDFDNIEIGVKSTLHREFDVAAVLDALKERGEIVTKFAYANWGRQEAATRPLSEHAVQMVQRDPSPRGDKNGADINLALDALEMAFTHDHINAFAIVSGDSDFIALVNKLKQYDKRIFVVGGRAFTSTILQKNCHEFVAYEAIIDDAPRSRSHERPPAEKQQHSQQQPAQGQPQQGPQQGPPQQRSQHKRVALDLTQSMPLVERALGVLERREVRPQLGLLKSTMLQLDSTFNEKAYGASSFTDFVEKLQKADFVDVSGGEGRYMIRLKGSVAADKPGAKPEEAIPLLRDVLETHRLDVDNGALAEDLAEATGAGGRHGAEHRAVGGGLGGRPLAADQRDLVGQRRSGDGVIVVDQLALGAQRPRQIRIRGGRPEGLTEALVAEHDHEDVLDRREVEQTGRRVGRARRARRARRGHGLRERRGRRRRRG